ncbi:SHOCT domain-containing protein [Halogeometricum borinquense]|uniref:SHOCT domain-containing protein n=1 Tax=Halogeometricum borinquense TaxID=60847 RepID=UPI001F5DAB58|nr:SHOCT domain-containing protein [Halogeometricum borinquense]
MTEANQLDSPRRANADQHDDALARLRERYAEGKIDEAEFERRVEQLLRPKTMTPQKRSSSGKSRPETASPTIEIRTKIRSLSRQSLEAWPPMTTV